ncbi:MAG: pyrroloquinoline-quinone synthase PqqC [Deltaproteobacteria bacterium]|nr:pyrroloquinoline-quinone synthase PqqC [Deltaproteobacteria bacterium]
MTPLGREELVERLRAEASTRYHDRHPFHVRMHEGLLSREELQVWVANRFCYQARIPRKDALILSKSDDPAFRRAWIRRIHDHDDPEGGIAMWLELARGVGLDPDEVRSERGVRPAVRFACDAYLTLVRERSLVEAVASSLTEFFSPELMEERLAAWERHYPWVDRATLAYFRARVPRARTDATEALEYVVRHADTRALQERCIEAFVTKCDILWAILDAIDGG